MTMEKLLSRIAALFAAILIPFGASAQTSFDQAINDFMEPITGFLMHVIFSKQHFVMVFNIHLC